MAKCRGNLYGVRDPYRNTVVSHAPRSSVADLNDALDAAVSAKAKAAAAPGYERAALLRRAGKLLVDRAERIAEIMARKTGKAVKDAKAEIVRSRDTLSLSAEEAVRIEGEHVPLDASAMGAGKIFFMLRFPVGVVAGITPFNAPFNLACHKIAPAIAAGNTLVLKAPLQSPGVIHALAQIFVDAGTPAGVLNVLYGDVVGPALVRDPRVDFITFTGSSASAPISRWLPACAASHSNSAAMAQRSRTKMRQSPKRLQFAPARHAACWVKLHFSTNGVCPPQRLRLFRRTRRRRRQKAEIGRPARSRDRCWHADRRARSTTR